MFWKNRKPREPSYVSDKTVIRNIARNIIDISSYDIEYKNLYEAHELQEIFEYIDINTAISTLVRGVTSREMIFTSENGKEEDKTVTEEGQKRLNNIKGKINFVRELAKTPFLKITVHEIIYNENFEIERLDFIPRELIRYDKEKKIFYIQSKLSEKIYLNNPMKWHVAIYNEDVTKPYGETLLKPILKTYEEIKYIKGKMNGIIEKYGGTIVLFGYDSKLKDHEVRETAMELKKMMDKNTVGMPISKNGPGIKDNIVLLRLADLNVEIHTLLMEKLERKIFQNLLGSTLTVSDGTVKGNGTQALGTIHQEEKEKIEDEIAFFVREELDKLVDIDGLIHGYDPNQYYIEINRQQDRKKELEIKNLEQDEINKKADQIVKLSQAGYEIEDTELQEVFGYKTIKKKEQRSNNTFFEFSKKNTEDSNKKTLEYLEKLRKRIVPEISGKIREQIQNIKSIEDIKNIDTGTKDHENALILSELWGHYLTIKDRGKIKEYKKQSEFAAYSEIDLQDIFNMTFNEAINWLLNREPLMYDQIQRIIENYRANYFWIKRSTDLETTKTLCAELLKNLELGQTFEDFKKNLDIESLGFGEDGYYLRQVFDQTMINAQAVGQWEQLQEGIQYGFIYGLYDAIVDGRETAICRELDGKIYRLDDPFWMNYYPPNHFKCRSRVMALSEEDMQTYGYSSGNITPEMEPQKGFDKNIGSNYISGIKRYVNQKEKEAEILYEKAVNYEG